MEQNTRMIGLSRRAAMGRIAAFGTAVAAGASVGCAQAAPQHLARPGGPGHSLRGPRTLAFHNIHTSERTSITYHDGRRWDDQAYAALNSFLKDWRTGEVYPIDRDLLDLLERIRRLAGTDITFDVISAYRSPKTNAVLASRSAGVSRRSYHMRGQAIDISIPEIDLRSLHRMALSVKGGGVGLYSGSSFIHVDTGPVRTWGA